MTIASEITNYANGLSDAYDAVNDMSGLIPTDKNMNNLDTAIRTIPQNLGPTYTAGNGIVIDQNDEISIDDTVVAELSDLPTKTSELQNDGSDGTSTYVEADDLATVATSGDYGDLLNKPTIPTVNDAILTITQNGTSAGTFTANSSTNTTIALTDTTYSDFTGATSLADGAAGLVPKPLAGDETKFLSGNGQWTTVSQYNLPIASANDLGGIKVGSNLSIDSGTGVLSATDTTYSDFTGATTQQAGAAGLVPAPTTSDPEKYLKGDGTWDTPTDTTYSAGTNVQISAGNVISATDTTYSDFTGATSGAAGAHGLVPAPAAGDQDKVLSGAGTWVSQSGGTTYTAGSHIDITSDVISAEGYIWGDDAAPASTPASTITSAMIVDGTIQATDIATGVVPIITMTNTDPGEGSPLAANNFVAVYGEDPSNMNYSLNETKTGATWIDGSPIYKKTINFGALPNATTKSVSIGVANVDHYIKFEGVAWTSTGTTIILPFVNPASASYQISAYIDSGNMIVTAGDNKSGYSTCYVTVYYTKSS